MNFLLNVDNIDKTKAIEGLNDKLFYGGRMLLIGMLTIFAVLITLWISLVVFKFFFHDLARAKKTKTVKSEQPAPVFNAPVASENDENYSAYLKQADRAYKLLIKYAKGVKLDKTFKI